MINPNELYDTLDEKIAEFDRAIEASTKMVAAGTEMIDSMKAQRGLLVALRDTISTLELNDFAQRARAEDLFGGLSDQA